ncbi:MAG: Ig-like domain-containing protein [Balneolaceae bacterium]|nr:Ig-like domain-containing protein [Balneolaceae bacterium]
MDKRNPPFLIPVRQKIPLLLLLAFVLTAWGCTTSGSLLNQIPIHSVTVQVLDQQGNPIQGAQVQTSSGRASSTNEEGMAEVNFGAVGVHSITVLADNHLPSNFVVTMPADNGETYTRRLAEEIQIGTISFGSINLYPMIFNYMFSSYGYSHAVEDYEEGEYTTWSVYTEEAQEDSITMTRAFLTENDNGQQWWRIEMRYPDRDDNYTAEMLFSEDRTSILRYRERIGQGEPQEKPVSDNWYSKPVQLTEESMEGAVSQSDVSVTVPSGTFTADLLEFGVASETTLRIWRVRDGSVPGGAVKYETVEGSELDYSSELVDYGTDAETVLNSY